MTNNELCNIRNWVAPIYEDWMRKDWFRGEHGEILEREKDGEVKHAVAHNVRELYLRFYMDAPGIVMQLLDHIDQLELHV